MISRITGIIREIMMENEEYPKWLINQVVSGQAILFLGAGASRGAIRDGKTLNISGNDLRDLLSDHFLGGEEKSRALSRVGDFCKNRAGLFPVQDYIHEIFDPYNPAPFQLLIPQFKWWAIFTTNYDLLVERAYDQTVAKKQRLGKIIRDNDRFSEVLKDSSVLPFIKLHGCISVTHDENLPLILASEEYAKHRKNRERLFRTLQDWGREHPIIFCGYDLSDPNIMQIFFDLTDNTITRPQYAVVSPDLSDNDISFWFQHRVIPIKKKFEDFMIALDEAIPRFYREIGSLMPIAKHPILQLAVSKEAPSTELIHYLETELDFIRKEMPIDNTSAQDYFRGINNNWGPYFQELDVRRRVTDSVIADMVLSDGIPSKRIALIKGFAGSGKTAVLRRIAFDSSQLFEQIVLWVREGGLVRSELILQLYQLLRKRLVLVVDDAISQLGEIKILHEISQKNGFEIVFVIGARTNEWNIYADASVFQYVEEFELRNLSQSEIEALLTKLEKHNCLGALQKMSKDERTSFFYLTADRQLLVALHEATSGKKFKDILLDEYRKIVPLDAQILYIDIATLNRLGVGVRAGLISRVSGISFEEFKDRLYLPLESVIEYYYDNRDRDYHYRTRHCIIAEMIFDLVLDNPQKRADQIVRIIRHLNTDYGTDDKAFSEIIKGRTIASLFADRRFGEEIYNAAKEVPTTESFVEHQRAIFELNHRNGSLEKAQIAIKNAEILAKGKNTSILHTKSMILRKMALASPNQIERDKYRADALSILSLLITEKFSAYPFHTMAEMYYDQILERIERIGSNTMASGSQFDDRMLVELIEKVQEIILRGENLFPSDEYLSSIDARIAFLLQQKEKATEILLEAFNKNPRSQYLAKKISEFYEAKGDNDKAISILRKCLQDNPQAKSIHLALACMLSKIDEQGYLGEIKQNLQSSYSDGDSNLQAQFIDARFNYIYGDKVRARKLFAFLSRANVENDYRTKRRGVVANGVGVPKIYHGMVISLTDRYSLIECSEINDKIIALPNCYADSRLWENLYEKQNVSFQIMFNYLGPIAVNISLS